MNKIRRNLGKAFSKSLKYYQTLAKALDLGLEMIEVDPQTRDFRLSLCNSCDKLMEGQCILCDCLMEFKTTLKYMPFQVGTKQEDKELIACDMHKW